MSKQKMTKGRILKKFAKKLRKQGYDVHVLKLGMADVDPDDIVMPKIREGDALAEHVYKYDSAAHPTRFFTPRSSVRAKELMADAKEWLEANTPMRWTTEATGVEADIPLERLNARCDRRALELATFAAQCLRKYKEER